MTGQSFTWHLGNKWVLTGFNPSGEYRQAPFLTLYRMGQSKAKSLDGSEYVFDDINKCTETYTPYDREFAAKLTEVFAAREKEISGLLGD